MANEPKEVARKKKTSSSTSSSSTSKKTSKNTKKVEKEISKIAKKSPIGIIVIIACIVIGLAGGFIFVSSLTKNDTFEMNAYVHQTSREEVIELFGEETFEYTILLLEEEYVEPGAKCVFLGKNKEVNISYSYREDISFEPITVDDIDTTISGFYYVTYTNTTFKYQNVVLIRTVQVMEVENNG
ncbi:MAG: hypothetical protein ACI4U5_06100 [Bacilli bacterium]